MIGMIHVAFARTHPQDKGLCAVCIATMLHTKIVLKAVVVIYLPTINYGHVLIVYVNIVTNNTRQVVVSAMSLIISCRMLIEGWTCCIIMKKLQMTFLQSKRK